MGKRKIAAIKMVHQINIIFYVYILEAYVQKVEFQKCGQVDCPQIMMPTTVTLMMRMTTTTNTMSNS